MDTKQKHAAAMRKARAAKLAKQAEREAEKAQKKAYIDNLKAIVKAEREIAAQAEREKRKAEREAEKAARALEAAKEAAKRNEPTLLERWQQECDAILDELQGCPKNADKLMRRYSELQYRIETEQNMQDSHAAVERSRASREVQVVHNRPSGLLSK
ncbi:MAG: hypothetical protein J5651_00385 [Salinivirgaceae bacterium]|nr:hypothetical protein [Salinivirgaceae bacterium]